MMYVWWTRVITHNMQLLKNQLHGIIMLSLFLYYILFSYSLGGQVGKCHTQVKNRKNKEAR